jgi:hypothetical protein
MATVRLQVSGQAELTSAIRKARKRFPEAFAGALYRLGVRILANALPRTPVEFGPLRASGYVSPPRKSDEPSVEIGFGTRYAVVQHQSPGFRHPRGGEAFYLRNAIDALTPSALVMLARDAAALAASGKQFGVEGGTPTRPRFGPDYEGSTQKAKARARRARAAVRRRTGR